jgi:hypothetical protein
MVSSRRNGLVTIYDVAEADDNEPMRLDSQPSCLFFPSCHPAPYPGRIILAHGHQGEHITSASLVYLSEDGALHHADFGPSNTVKDVLHLEVDWLDGVKAPEEDRTHREFLSSDRQKNTVNLSTVYDRKL